MRKLFLALFLYASCITIASAQSYRYIEREIAIPWIKADDQGLDALLVYAQPPEKHPLVVMTHGTAREREQRDNVTPWQLLPEATWFARRGWLVVVVVRRGYGRSGGKADYLGHHCPQTDYQDSGEKSAEDLRRAVEYGQTLPEVDPTRVIAVGVSTGGFATVALTADPPPGLVAAINFAGGRGSQHDNDVCNPGDLIRAYKNFGKRSRTPMLWIYAENDKYFWPELAARFDEAFRSAGGQDQFVMAQPFAQDGHGLFRQGMRIWSPIVDDFLKSRSLVPVTELLPEPAPPNVPAPAGLSDRGEKAFRSYLALGPHKAFAVSERSFGYATARMTTDDARRVALENCTKAAPSGESCRIVSIDNSSPAP